MFAITDFSSELRVVSAQHFFGGKTSATMASELNAIATALATDPTTYDATIQAPPAALLVGPAQTRFSNDVLLLVNIAKGGNVAPSALSTAISSGIANFVPPANTAAPVASGTGTVGQTLSCTNGTWSNTPTSFAYQWQRDGVSVGGATASSYVLVAADSGHSLTCRVVASNAAGAGLSASSNAIAVA